MEAFQFTWFSVFLSFSLFLSPPPDPQASQMIKWKSESPLSSCQHSERCWTAELWGSARAREEMKNEGGERGGVRVARQTGCTYCEYFTHSTRGSFFAGPLETEMGRRVMAGRRMDGRLDGRTSAQSPHMDTRLRLHLTGPGSGEAALTAGRLHSWQRWLAPTFQRTPPSRQQVKRESLARRGARLTRRIMQITCVWGGGAKTRKRPEDQNCQEEPRGKSPQQCAYAYILANPWMYWPNLDGL